MLIRHAVIPVKFAYGRDRNEASCSNNESSRAGAQSAGCVSRLAVLRSSRRGTAISCRVADTLPQMSTQLMIITMAFTMLLTMLQTGGRGQNGHSRHSGTHTSPHASTSDSSTTETRRHPRCAAANRAMVGHVSVYHTYLRNPPFSLRDSSTTSNSTLMMSVPEPRCL